MSLHKHSRNLKRRSRRSQGASAHYTARRTLRSSVEAVKRVEGIFANCWSSVLAPTRPEDPRSRKRSKRLRRISPVLWRSGPVKNGAPGETRTPDPLVRSQMLYPAELRARVHL